MNAGSRNRIIGCVNILHIPIVKFLCFMTSAQKKFVYSKMQAIGKKVADEVPGYGFLVIVFPFGEGEKDEPVCNYVSNATRRDLIPLLRDFIARTATDGQFKD